MSEFNNDIEDVEQSDEQSEAMAELEAMLQDLEEEVEAMPPLPKEENAELGGLCRPRRGQFEGCQLLEEGDSDLIGFLIEEPNDTEGVEEYYEEVAPKVSSEGWNIAASNLLGWGWETPVGTVPMGLMEPNEVIDFIESATKPWPKADPRREESQ